MSTNKITAIIVIVILAILGSGFIVWQAVKINKLEKKVQKISQESEKSDDSAETTQSQADDAEEEPATSKTKTIKQFCFINSVISKNNTTYLSADYAQWFVGQTAIKAARADGAIGANDTPDNDYYIRNNNPKLRELEIDSSVAISISKSPGEISQRSVSLKEFEDIFNNSDPDFESTRQSPYWLVLKNNKITKITQQFIP